MMMELPSNKKAGGNVMGFAVCALWIDGIVEGEGNNRRQGVKKRGSVGERQCYLPALVSQLLDDFCRGPCIREVVALQRRKQQSSHPVLA